jgi:hypothetical protein
MSWWESTDVKAFEGAAACSVNPGRFGNTSYLYQTSWLGVSYAVEGLFIPVGKGLLQIEVATPVAKRAFLHAVFNDWAGRVRSALKTVRVVKMPD